jgi:hypothetical protein
VPSTRPRASKRLRRSTARLGCGATSCPAGATASLSNKRRERSWSVGEVVGRRSGKAAETSARGVPDHMSRDKAPSLGPSVPIQDGSIGAKGMAWMSSSEDGAPGGGCVDGATGGVAGVARGAGGANGTGGPISAAAGRVSRSSNKAAVAAAARSAREARIRDDLFDARGRSRNVPKHEEGAAADNDHHNGRDQDEKYFTH